MRIAAVGIHRNNRQILCDQTFTTESLSQPVLEVALRDVALADAPANLLEALRHKGSRCAVRSRRLQTSLPGRRSLQSPCRSCGPVPPSRRPPGQCRESGCWANRSEEHTSELQSRLHLV